MKVLDIKQEPYFTNHFRLFGGILIFGCFVVLLTQQITIWIVLLSIVFFLLGLIMITTYYGLKINVEKRTYTIYTWIFGFKTGTPERFEYIEKFYIKEVSEDAVMTSRGGLQFDISKRVFKIFMKLDNGEKVHVDTDKDLGKLEKRMEDYIELTAPILTGQVK